MIGTTELAEARERAGTTEPVGRVDQDNSGFVAVIGMAGRFPGAADVDEFWSNLLGGVESISVLTDQLDSSRPDFTPAYGLLRGADEFDAGFFGYSPNEALLIDPQQRLLLECAHQALERAGHAGSDDLPTTGIFVGGATTGYADALRAQLDRLPFVDEWQVRLATAADFLGTRTAYKLGLGGPAVAVQSACSTSLVAVHLAIQSLLAGDCEIVIAGGAAVHARAPRIGYTEGGIVSPDAHCRAFDASAQGTVGGSAVALVVLRPLADAIADGDHVHAVIRGSAVNNDGADKIGFTAPSVSGQVTVIRAAHLVADVDPSDIGYVEAHGTATRLGDPIEIAALTKAFRAGTEQVGYCRIGSVKTNIGHTDAAAGVAGLIKTILAVEHGLLPASLHFQRSNPEIDFASSPFLVNDELREWGSDGKPRLAGVSALGVGGTNAHVILQQPPARPSTRSTRPHQLIALSAKTDTAVRAMSRRLAAHLRNRPVTDLADVAWTLQAGRAAYEHRCFAVCADAGDAVSVLTGDDPGRAYFRTVEQRPRDLVFMFPGQGGQHMHMTEQLYWHYPVFRAQLDECAEIAAPLLGMDLRGVLFPDCEQERAVAAGRLGTIAVSQPAVFVVECALARLLLDWGLRPGAVVGHSLGAYMAAHLAGVLSLADAVRLVAKRGELLQSLPAGGMAAVRLPEAELQPLLSAGLCIGAVNGPRQCTVTGPAALVSRFAEQLAGQQIETRVLHIPTAGHSALVEPILDEFREFLAELEFQRPQLPMVSDRTGDWADPAHLVTPDYWVRHLRQPVRFEQVLATLLDQSKRALVEAGPGNTLVTLARQHPDAGDDLIAVQTLPHPAEETADLAVVLTAVGHLWASGVPVDWARLHDGERERPGRVVLPSYPFERQRYLVPPVVRATPNEPAADGTGIPHEVPAGWVSVGEQGAAPPSDPSEQDGNGDGPVLTAVLNAFGAALGVRVSSTHESFFDLGGDSLIATKLASWARNAFRIQLSPADILRSRTAAALTEIIEERAGMRAVTDAD